MSGFTLRFFLGGERVGMGRAHREQDAFRVADSYRQRGYRVLVYDATGSLRREFRPKEEK